MYQLTWNTSKADNDKVGATQTRHLSLIILTTATAHVERCKGNAAPRTLTISPTFTKYDQIWAYQHKQEPPHQN